MIFVDANVFMYAVGRAHPLKAKAQAFFETHIGRDPDLVTSAEVLQELLHVYRPANRLATFDAALTLAESLTTVWSLEPDDIHHARGLAARHPDLTSRDLVHLACCRRRGASDLHTYDHDLRAAWTG